MKNLLKNWWILTLRGLILAGLGVFTFGFPAPALFGQIGFYSIAILVSGLLLIIVAFTGWHMESRWWWLAGGILDLIFGGILIKNTAMTPDIFPVLLAFWALFTGILLLSASFEFRREKVSQWWFGLIAGAVMILFGLWILRSPEPLSMTTSILLALQMILAGAYTAVLSFFLSGLKEEEEKVSAS